MTSNQDISRQTRDLLIECAREMRQSPTDAEAFLWTRLRKRSLAGYKFRHQHIIQTYIVDFYCPAAKLVIEVDGPIHNQRIAYDRERDTDLRAMGYKILRFSNENVMNDISDVLEQIKAKIKFNGTNPTS
jgi:very-short-patch-repair endonuclease